MFLYFWASNMLWRKCVFDCFLCQFMYFRKKLNYAKNISESCYNGNAKLLNVLKFYFDLKERHDKLYYTVKKYRLLIYHDLQIWMIWKKWDIRKFLTWHAFMNRFSFYFSCMIYFYDEMHITCFYNKYCIFVSGCFFGGYVFENRLTP